MTILEKYQNWCQNRDFSAANRNLRSRGFQSKLEWLHSLFKAFLVVSSWKLWVMHFVHHKGIQGKYKEEHWNKKKLMNNLKRRREREIVICLLTFWSCGSGDCHVESRRCSRLLCGQRKIEDMVLFQRLFCHWYVVVVVFFCFSLLKSNRVNVNTLS